ncbi:MAG: hypothetical protein H7X89_14640 [Rhizobiales bacterium]|nr:hypothetical protein [Hyphomicrobiales bacterium]
MGLILGIAALWGLAEATLFFIVPDVWLTWVLLRHGWRRAALASLAACGGALLGGALMFAWGSTNAEAARNVLEGLPAIAPEMITAAARDLHSAILWPLIEGGFRGVPYKIYAVEAGAMGTAIAPFMAATVMARLLRFWAAIVIVMVAAGLLRKRFSETAVKATFAAGWIAFYGVYFTLMPG